MNWSYFFVLGPVSNFSWTTTFRKTDHPKSRVSLQIKHCTNSK